MLISVDFEFVVDSVWNCMIACSGDCIFWRSQVLETVNLGDCRFRRLPILEIAFSGDGMFWILLVLEIAHS